MNLKRIQRPVSCGPLATLTLKQLSLCHNCIQCKMTKRSFTTKGGYEYFITFTDDYSGYGYVYLMKKKSEALDKFKEFEAKSEKQLRRHIKSLRFDQGCEYMSIEFVSFLKEHEILSQLSAPGTPHQNGVTEKRN